MLVRREAAADGAAIDVVHRHAFARPGGDGDPPEVALVGHLRADPGWVPALSFVADDGGVVGQVVCTVGSIDGTAALGLGPLGVLPDRQRDGVGSALVHTVLGAADALAYPVVALLGDPRYYARFGFVAATTIGIDPPDPAWGAFFQARPLHAWTPGVRGAFRYAAPFAALG